jgi:anaerobic magnesium-protoporphyrin IX monomethyl ester cyclase
VKTRLLLLKPPEESRFNFGAFSLGVLAAAVRDRAEVAILDATRLKPGDVVREVAARAPDLLGITVMGPGSVGPVAGLIRRFRETTGGRTASARTVILAGGHGGSMVPEPLLAAGADAVVIGEGERTLAEILERGVRPGAAGVACMAGGRTVLGLPQAPIQPLDRLPLPARDLMPPPPDDVHLLETSRGCPHACSFCEATRFHGRLWRAHSPERVAVEVAGLIEERGAWVIEFADDNFAASPARVLRICELLRAGPLPALILVSARVDDLGADPRLLPAMASARMLRISVGVETLDHAAAALAGKPIAASTYREVFARMRDHGIFSVASLIVGLEGETFEARHKAADRAIQVGPDAARFLPFLPRPAVRTGAAAGDFEPKAADVRDARLFTQAFYRHRDVRERLELAAQVGGIRGMLARGTLRNWEREGAGEGLPPGEGPFD